MVNYIYIELCKLAEHSDSVEDVLVEKYLI